MKLINCIILLLLLSCSCSESNEQRKERLMSEWKGREIAFPSRILCVAGEDTLSYKIPNSDFLVMTYADSAGCVDFRKQLSGWKRVMAEADSITKGNVSFVFFLKPGDIDEIRYIFHKEKFIHPVYFDLEDKLYALNKFPEEIGFRSFLLDRSRQVLTMGNPAMDAEVEKMYAKIIAGGALAKEPEKTTTEVSYTSNVFDMGAFDWKYPHDMVVSLKNSGNTPLVVDDVITSSTCMYVEYSRTPVPPGKKWELYIRYRAARPEVFNRDITIYCNTVNSPLNFKVRGSAE